MDDRTLEIETTGTVEGSVFLDVDGSGTLTSDDEPAPGIRVRIVRAGQAAPVATAESDSSGAFQADSVPVGEFLLTVDPASVPDSVQVSGLDTTTFVVMPGETVRRDFRLSFPEYSLAEVRELETGLRVFTHGIALNTRFSFGDGIVHLREGDVHLRVTEVARGSVTPHPQDSVRVLGRTAREAGRPILTDARLFVLQPEAVLPLVPEDVGTGTAATADDARLDAALVRIREARILDTIPEGLDLIAVVDDGSGPVEVRIRDFLFVDFDRSSLEPGTRQLRGATGLLEAVEDEAGAVRWRLLLRSAGDVSAVDEYVPPAVSASGSTVAAEPDTLVADGVAASTVTVMLRTAEGEVIDEPRTVTLTVDAGPGALSTGAPEFDPGTNSYTATLTSTAAGTAVVAAVADGVALTQQPWVEFVAGPAASLDVTGGQGQSGGTGAPLADSLEVRVADAFGNPVAGALVTWTPGEGSGSADPAASETDAAGLTRTSWTLGTDAGEQTLVAATDRVGDGVTFTATAEAAAVSPSQSSVTAQPGTVVADGQEAATVTVTLRDGQGNLIEDERTVTLEVTEGPGSLTAVTFDAATSTYAATIASTGVGFATVVATADGTILDDQPQVEFVPGPVSATESSVGSAPSAVTADGVEASTVTVTLRDDQQNLITEEHTVTLAVVSGPGVVSAVTFDAGTSSYTATITSTETGVATIEATVVGADPSDGSDVTLAQTATVQFTVGDVSASQSTVTAEPTSRTADGVEASQVTVTLRDDEGNLIEEPRPVELSVAEGIGVFANPQPPFDPATSTYTTTLTSTEAGTATIVAEADGAVLDDQPQVEFLPGTLSADESLVVADPGEVVADGVDASNITVTLRDAQQNVITEAHTVTLEIFEGPGALSTTTPAFDPATNTYSATVTSTDSGVTTVRATAGGTPLTQDAVVEFVSGAVSASLSSAVAAPTEVVADGADASTITVTLRDGQGNLITEQVTVTVLVATGPGSLSPVTFDPGTSTHSATLTSADVGTTTVAVVADGVALDDRPVVDFVPGPVSAGESSLVADPAVVTADGTDASTLTVTLRDAQQHLITEEQAVTLTVIDGPGTLTAVAFDAVTSTYSATLTSTSSGTATVQATADGVTLTQQAVVDFAAGDVSAGTSSVVADPIEVTADGVDASTVTVTLRDGEGNIVEDEQTVVLSTVSGPGTLSAVAFDGATSTYSATLTSTVADTTTVAAEANGATITEQAEVVFVAGPAAALFISAGDGQTGTVGETLPESLEVRVADANDNPVEGIEVTWTPADGHGTAAPVASITGPAGLARTAWTLGTGTGEQRITAGVDGLTSVEFTATAEVGPVSATVSSMTASPTGGVTADGSDASTVTAVLMDEFGNRISGLVEEDFLALLQGDGGDQAVRGSITELGSPPARYVFDVTNTAAETVTVTLTADGVTLEDRPTIEFVPGGVSAETSSVVADPTEVTADGTSESVITVTLRDGEGNLIEDEQTVVLSIVSGPGTLSALTFDGVTSSYSATLTSTVADTTTVAAEANGTAITQQAEVVFVAGEAAQLAFTSSEADLASGATRTLTAEVRDAAGNLVTGDTGREVTFAQTAGDGTVTGLGTASTTGGIAELEVTGDLAGSVTIAATATGLTSDTTTFMVTAGDE